MLRFQPPGFGQKSIQCQLGKVAYYTPIAAPWPVGKDQTAISNASSSDAASKQRPIAIFFHNFGGGASAYEWSKVYAALAANYTVIAPDLIGWGASAHPARCYTAQDYIDSIEELIEQVASGPILAIASSLTAGLVIQLAAKKPALFQKLFLTCPAGFRDFGENAGRRLPEPIINTPFLDKAIYALGATNELAVRNFLENFLFFKRDRLSNETVSAYLSSAQQSNAEYAALSFLRGDLYFDLAPHIEQLQVPTAMVWGEKAQFTSVSLGKRLASLNPYTIKRFQVVSDTGVLPHLEQPGAVTALLLDWLLD